MTITTVGYIIFACMAVLGGVFFYEGREQGCGQMKFLGSAWFMLGLVGAIGMPQPVKPTPIVECKPQTTEVTTSTGQTLQVSLAVCEY